MGRLPGGAEASRRHRGRRGTAASPPWPDWAITTVIDTSRVWPTVWRAVVVSPDPDVHLRTGSRTLPDEHQRALWGTQEFYRVFSTRQRRPPRAKPISSRGCDDRDATALMTDALHAAHHAAEHAGRRVSRRSGIGWWISWPTGLRDLADGPCRGERLAGRASAALLDAARGASRGRRRRRPTGATARRPAVRSLAVQRAPALLRLHHLEPGADRHVRRLPRRRAQPERRRVERCRRSPPRSSCQTVRWIAELIGLPPGGGGLLVSGGNMANFVGFLAARAAEGGVGRAQGGRGARLARCASTCPAKRTRGCRRPPTCSASAPTRSAGSPPTARSGWTWRRCGGRSRQDARDGRPAVPRRSGTAGIGQHRRGRSAGRDRGGVPRARNVVSRGRRLRRAWPRRRRRAGSAARARRGRLGRRRSAQVALRAARSRLRRSCAIRTRCAKRSPTTRRTTASTNRS